MTKPASKASDCPRSIQARNLVNKFDAMGRSVDQVNRMAVRLDEELNVLFWVAARIPTMLHWQKFQLFCAGAWASLKRAEVGHRIYFYFHTPAIVREGVGHPWGHPSTKLFTRYSQPK